MHKFFYCVQKEY